MATKTYTVANQSSSSTKSWTYKISSSDINAWVAQNIPANSTINSVRITCGCKKNSTLARGTLVFKVAGNTIFTADKEIDSVDEYSVNQELKSYVQTNNSNSGYINGNIEFNFSSTLKATFYINNIVITFDYTPIYTVTVNALPTEGGTVTGGGSYEYGTKATVTAIPSLGYEFKGWADQNGNIQKTDNPYIFTVNANTKFYAVFEKLPPQFTSAGMKYLDKQISNTNKVIAGESFVISVGVT